MGVTERSGNLDRRDTGSRDDFAVAAIVATHRTLLEGSSDGIIVVDAMGGCLAANPVAANLLDYGPDDWRRLAVTDLLVDHLGSFLNRPHPWHGCGKGRQRDGTLVPVDIWSTNVEHSTGTVSLVFLREIENSEGADAIAARSADDETPGAKAVIEVTLEGIITGWNFPAERLYGYPARDVLGRSLAKLAPSESIGDIVSILAGTRQGEWIKAFSTSHLTKTGCRIDVCVDVLPVRNRQGEIVSGAVVVRDVIGCARAEQELRRARASVKDANRALRESEERFRGAFDGAPIGMALVAPDGRFMQVNPALSRILGYGGEELLTRTFSDVTHPDDRNLDQNQARQLLDGEIDTYQIEKRFLRIDGQSICGRLTISLVRGAELQPRHFVAQIQDITLFKAAGAALREAEARYRTLVEQIPAAVYVAAGESLGTTQYMSPRIEPLLGYSPRDWVQDPDLRLRAIHDEDRARILDAVAVNEGAESPIHLEYRYVARDGREVWVHDQVALVRGEDGASQYWQGFMVDITDRKRAEEAMRLAKEMAEEANRVKSAFLSMATHELRTPLTIISGYVELLAESAAPHLTPEEKDYLDIAQTGAHTLTALVDDLLDLARMEAGRLEMQIRPVDVGEAVERVRRLAAAQAASKGIVLEVDLEPGLPLVAADQDRLVQVLLNLLGNAIKFTEEGTVRAAVRRSRRGVEISVLDTGIGIASDALPKIFEEFRQADVGTTRRFGGSGLGLAIAKRLVELQGGSISVESTEEVGSTFRIWLPAANREHMNDGFAADAGPGRVRKQAGDR